MTTSSSSDGQTAASAVPLEFKGTTLSVTAIVIGNADPAKLQQMLFRKLAEAPGFFEGELALLDLTRLMQPALDDIDLPGLVKLLRQAGMIPVAARGLAPAMKDAAEALGLAVLAAAPMRRAQQAGAVPSPAAAQGAAVAPRSAGAPSAAQRPSANRTPASASAAAPAAPRPAAAQRPATAGAVTATARPATAGATAAAPAAAAPAPAAAAAEPRRAADERSDPVGSTAHDTITALVVERPLRSGQRVYARGRDLVLLDGISPGAEVIADGSIHCYGPLRGRALAGASGDVSARIFATDFQAELVSIAGVYRTFELNDEQIRGGQPVRIGLRDDGLSQAIAIERISGD